VTRLRKHGVELTLELEWALTFGPGPICDEFSDEDLEIGWSIHGEKLMEKWERRHGSRPWGWWVFTVGEEPPPMEPGAKEIRLAELGELTKEELAAIAERAAEAKATLESGRKNYIATGGGQQLNFEQEAVELYERVTRCATQLGR
jgi:hypothetical protein